MTQTEKGDRNKNERVSSPESVLNYLKGRFLKFRRYYNFANLSSELLESTFYKRNKQVSVKSIELTVLDKLFCKGFPDSAAHTSYNYF